MLISVVIIFYNQEALVRRAVCSVLRQTYRELDVIVVDDGSDVSVEGRIQGLQDSRIRFFRQENGGPASARNRGIQEARGDYIAFLDGDDVYLPDRVEALVDFLEKRGKPKCLLANGAYVVNERNRIINRVRPRSYKTGEQINTSLVRPSCTMYHAGILKEKEGFPLDMCSNEDGALNVVLSQSYPVLGLDRPLVLYRQDEGGLARCHLKNYESAASVLVRKLQYISERVTPPIAEAYRLRASKDLLYGFLSSGNLDAARSWKLNNPYLEFESGFSFELAKLSLKSGINVYRIVRSIYTMLLSCCFFSVQIRYRKFLRL